MASLVPRHCATRQLVWPSTQQRFSTRWYSQHADRADEPKKEPTADGPQTPDDLIKGDGTPVRMKWQIIWAAAFTAGVFCLSSNLCADRYLDNLEKIKALVKAREAGVYTDSTDDIIQQLMGIAAVQALVGSEFRGSKLGQAKAINYIARLPDWVSPAAKHRAITLVCGLCGLSLSERCVYSMITLNIVVFGLWRIPRLLPTMVRHFLHQPHSGKAYTLLTSVFSHATPVHLILNMASLWATGILVTDVVPEEHYIAIYLSAGVISGLAMHIQSALYPAFAIGYLGASGAVYGLMGVVTVLYARNGKLSESFPLTSATMPIMLLISLASDCVGVALKWRGVGYVAHLTGGILGVAYAEWYIGVWDKLVRSCIVRRAKKDVAE
ncbi:hypothetical protein GGH94_000415 [Coemansia aciculifera]|uniref:Peptidase S54 rhomboid domain-containing protein n=1 Tax=Coemansia aciculifera TaxID=417176 RepID=A0A9W8M7B6_9FUNG|nr:hypothetical protein GGH94_000415 [Coemansia aciculifera]